MKKYLGGLALIAIVATCCLVGNSEGQQSGGFPSRPIFQALNIGTNATAGYAATATGQQIISRAGGPSVTLVDTTQAVNSRAFTLQSGSGGLNLLACPDSGSGCTNIATFPRTGAVAITGTMTADSFATAGTNCTGLTSGQLCIGAGNSLFTNLIGATTGSNITVAPGWLMGAGTAGGGQGAGTINAAAYYVNGVLFSPSSAHVTSDQSRSTITATCDAMLQLTLATGKTYAVRAFAAWTSTGGGVQAWLQYNGSSSTAIQSAVGRLNSAAYVPLQNTMGSFNYGGAALAASQDFVTYEGTITTTTSNTLCLDWRQNTAAGATVLITGSYLTATPIT